MSLSAGARKLLAVLLVVFAAAFPVFLYDRLVARQLKPDFIVGSSGATTVSRSTARRSG